VGKTWFANNSKGSEAGLSMDRLRLTALSSIGTKGEQDGEDREQWVRPEQRLSRSCWVPRRGQDSDASPRISTRDSERQRKSTFWRPWARADILGAEPNQIPCSEDVFFGRVSHGNFVACFSRC
jgi:hypothetical protein